MGVAEEEGSRVFLSRALYPVGRLFLGTCFRGSTFRQSSFINVMGSSPCRSFAQRARSALYALSWTETQTFSSFPLRKAASLPFLWEDSFKVSGELQFIGECTVVHSLRHWSSPQQ